MKKILYRITIVLAALITGIFLVLSITFVGDASSGPIEDFLSGIKQTIARVEDDYILKKRMVSRSGELEWFQPSLSDVNEMKNPPKLLLGGYDNQAISTLQPVLTLEDSLDTVFPLVHIYSAWGEKREQRFPIDLVQSIATLGSVPVITWEPWLNDFPIRETGDNPDLVNNNTNGLKAIAEGKYDTYLRTWAQDARRQGTTILVRLGHEMNDPYRYPWGPQNNEPEDFVAAWKHVIDLFRAENTNNILWVWAPHLAYGKFESYYPGDDYVDWIGTGTLNYGTVASWSQWWSFDEIFAKYYEELAFYEKPILIAEFGSLSVGGDQAKWYADALGNFPEKYPAVKGLIFFHNSKDATTTYQNLNWYIKDNPEITAAIKQQYAKWPVN